ncbi:MAG TPA: hypothetical protein VFW33_09330 [Gemmataceae bacterium]|nr:hypothetical protein [Gemmataceae bacterium]
MTWPLSQDYNEAIQNPAANFADPDLRAARPAANALGLPVPCSGNFADVYQLAAADGRRWAAKCFTREVPGLARRYEAVGRHLRRAGLPFTVGFTYLEKGILVAGRWYPVLKMEWVEGLTLNHFASRAADKPATLDALLHMWARLGTYLRAAEVAHADLQHGNVLLVPGAGASSLALKLVDYDGMWVPALAGRPSGEAGHPSYQHPARAREQACTGEVDRFPLLLVGTALRALRAGGRALWEKYDNGDNILFTEADLLAPTKSRLFYDLLRSNDPLTVTLAGRMIDALRGGLESAPLLAELLPEPPPTPTRTHRRETRTPPSGTRPVPAPVVVEFSPVEQEWPAAKEPPAPTAAASPPEEDAPKRRGVPALALAGGAGALALVAAVVVAVVGLGSGAPREARPSGKAVARVDRRPRPEGPPIADPPDEPAREDPPEVPPRPEPDRPAPSEEKSITQEKATPLGDEKEKESPVQKTEPRKQDAGPEKKPDPPPEKKTGTAPKKETAPEKKAETASATKEREAKKKLDLAMKLLDDAEKAGLNFDRKREKELKESANEVLRDLVEKYKGTEAAATAAAVLGD